MIVNTAVRNLQRNVDGITIDLELNHPTFGWIPFTASPNDVEAHGRAIYQSCIDGAFGPIADYVEPA